MVLAIGFFILTLSNFKMNADMGLLTAIIIAIALVVDFILLPAILLIFDNSTGNIKESTTTNNTTGNTTSNTNTSNNREKLTEEQQYGQ